MSPAPVSADPLYASGTFWAIVGVCVAIIFGAGAIIATYRAANPRRRLYVYASSTTPLMHRMGEKLGVEVRVGGEKLTNPHIVTARVISRGRRDIRKDAFDDHIRLQFGARIVGVLETSSKTEVAGTPVPNAYVDGEAIVVPPTLLRRDHELGYTVLVEGDTPSFSSLVPVEVDVRTTAPVDRKFPWLAGLYVILPSILFGGTILARILDGSNSDGVEIGTVAMGIAVVLVGLFFVFKEPKDRR